MRKRSVKMPQKEGGGMLCAIHPGFVKSLFQALSLLILQKKPRNIRKTDFYCEKDLTIGFSCHIIY